MDRAQTWCSAQAAIFEDGVVGHKVGETFDLNLKFPDDYKVNTELAGKDVTFEVTLNGVYK